MPSIKTKQTPIKNSVFNFKKKPKSSLTKFRATSPRTKQLSPEDISRALGDKALSNKAKRKRKSGRRSG